MANTAWAQRQQQAQRREAAEAHLASLGLLKGQISSDSSFSSSSGWVEAWPLELESFASVRSFATRVVKSQEGGGSEELAVGTGKLDLLVHAAATKEGCGTATIDGHDVGIQVNYLAPVLLTHLLTPALERGRNTNFTAGAGAIFRGNSEQSNDEDEDDEFSGTSSSGSGGALTSSGAGRVVWVTCGAGLVVPDWLPWPLSRTSPDTMPRLPLWHLTPGVHAPVGSGGAGASSAAGSEVKCPKGGPLAQFGDAKLAVAVYARELSRRLLVRAQHHRSGSSNSNNVHGAVSSHAVDPGTLNNGFGRSASAPPPKQSMQGKVMSYLPPVWIAQKVGAWLKAKLNVADAWAALMYRSPLHGALVALHVATNPSLGGGGAGGRAGGVGGIFSDTHGALWGAKCGSSNNNGVTEARECGRIPAAELPAAALNRTLSAALFDRTEELLVPYLEPLVRPPS